MVLSSEERFGPEKLAGLSASGPVGQGNGSSLAISAFGSEIARLRPNSEASLEATVASVGPTREVDASRGPAEVADATLQDATGTVKPVLWRPQITKVQAGQRVRLAGAWVKECRGKLQLSLGRSDSALTIVEANPARGRVLARGPAPRFVHECGGPRANASMAILGP